MIHFEDGTHSETLEELCRSIVVSAQQGGSHDSDELKAKIMRVIIRLFYFGSGYTPSRPMEHFISATEVMTSKRLYSKDLQSVVSVRIGHLFAHDQVNGSSSSNGSSNGSSSSSSDDHTSAAVVVLHSSHSRQLTYYYEDMLVQWHGVNRLNERPVSYAVKVVLGGSIVEDSTIVIPCLISKLILYTANVRPVPWDQYSFMCYSAALPTSVSDRGLSRQSARSSRGRSHDAIFSNYVPCMHAYDSIKIGERREMTAVPLRVANQAPLDGIFDTVMATRPFQPLNQRLYCQLEAKLNTGRK